MRLKADQTLFRDEEIFEPSHVPEDFLFREAEMKELAGALKPALRGSKPSNMFIFGRPATGKTTAVRVLFKELMKNTSKAIAVHINCHIYNSEYRILGEIHKRLFGFVPPETGLPVTALYDKVFKRLQRENKVLVIVLDDLSFTEIKTANEILYDLCRAHEAYPVRVGVWCISVQNELHRLEDKVRSTLLSNLTEFRPYNEGQMRDILLARADAGLFPGVINKKTVGEIASYASDLRHGLEIMRKTVNIAESDNSTQVKEKHMEKAVKSFEPPVSSLIIDDEKILLDLLKKSHESGELFEKYQKITAASYSKFYRMLQKLKKERKIVIQHVEKQQGRTSKIMLKK